MKSKGAVDTTTIPVHAIDDLISEAVIEQRPLAVAVKNSIRGRRTGPSSNETSDEPESAWAAEQRRRIAAAKANLENFERKRLAHLSELERAVIGDLEARCLAIAGRNRKFDLVSLSSMGTLAAAPGIASEIATKHKISEIEVFMLGANYLRESPTVNIGAARASRESAYLARSLVIARARILLERSRTTALLGLNDSAWNEKVNEIQRREEKDEAKRLKLSARFDSQNRALDIGRQNGREKRTANSIVNKDTALKMFAEWRQHGDNVRTKEKLGRQFVADAMNRSGYTVTEKGAKFTERTIAEYLRIPRTKK